MSQRPTDRWQRKAPRRTTDPVEARQIAEVTVQALQDIRASVTLEQMMATYRNWQSYAESMGVAAQIREHVRDAVNEVAITIKARRAVRDPTGEAA